MTRIVLLGTASLMILVISIVAANIGWDPVRGGQESPYFLTRSAMMILLQAGMLLIGIFFAAFRQRMKDLMDANAPQVAIGTELKKLASSTRFWFAMSTAPIIFCVILKLTDDVPNLAAVIIAFQNGFFWETVLPQAEANTLALTRR